VGGSARFSFAASNLMMVGWAPVANAPNLSGYGTSPCVSDKVVAGAVLLPIALLSSNRWWSNPKRRSGSG